jgi:hypothetical protein
MKKKKRKKNECVWMRRNDAMLLFSIVGFVVIGECKLLEYKLGGQYLTLPVGFLECLVMLELESFG